jgi:hypothetical protein
LGIRFLLTPEYQTPRGERCNANSLFQIACIGTGVIRTVNADAVIDILCPRDQQSSGTLEPAHNHSHQAQRTGQRDQEGNRHGAVRQRRRF